MRSLLLVSLLAFLLHLLLHHGLAAARCGTSIPTVRQSQVSSSGEPLEFMVVVQNSCSTCPVIDVHVRCGGFPQALASPTVFRVVGSDDCVVNNGLPLAPLQKVSFNYSYGRRFPMSPKSWYYQCE